MICRTRLKSRGPLLNPSKYHKKLWPIKTRNCRWAVLMSIKIAEKMSKTSSNHSTLYVQPSYDTSRKSKQATIDSMHVINKQKAVTSYLSLVRWSGKSKVKKCSLWIWYPNTVHSVQHLAIKRALFHCLLLQA